MIDYNKIIREVLGVRRICQKIGGANRQCSLGIPESCRGCQKFFEFIFESNEPQTLQSPPPYKQEMEPHPCNK